MDIFDGQQTLDGPFEEGLAGFDCLVKRDPICGKFVRRRQMLREDLQTALDYVQSGVAALPKFALRPADLLEILAKTFAFARLFRGGAASLQRDKLEGPEPIVAAPEALLSRSARSIKLRSCE